MQWNLRWGSEIQTLLDIRDSTGLVPKALQEVPVLDDRLSFFYGVFSELHEERRYSASGVPSRIPLTGFIAYCDFYRVPQIDREWMWSIVRIFDRVWVDEAIKKLKANNENKGK